MGYNKVEFINTPFDELLPGLNHKKYDIAMNNFSKTKARSIDYAASDSYAKAAFSIVAKKGSNLKADIDSMNGRKVAIKKVLLPNASLNPSQAASSLNIPKMPALYMQ